MSDPKFNPFAAALSSAQKYVADDRGPGMHNTLVCEHCGAAREAKSPIFPRNRRGPERPRPLKIARNILTGQIDVKATPTSIKILIFNKFRRRESPFGRWSEQGGGQLRPKGAVLLWFRLPARGLRAVPGS